MSGGIVFREAPEPLFVEHEGWLAVIFYVKHTPDVHEAGCRLIDVYREGGIDSPQVLVVDQSQAIILFFDRSRTVSAEATA